MPASLPALKTHVPISSATIRGLSEIEHRAPRGFGSGVLAAVSHEDAGGLRVENAKSDLVRLATRSIIEEDLEAEARDALGRAH